MTNLVLGVSRGLSVEVLNNWLVSSSRLSDTRVVLICLDYFVDESLKTLCKKLGVEISHKPSTTSRVHHARYLYAWEYLMEMNKDYPTTVVWSDVADVVFQCEDLNWSRGPLAATSLIVGSEGVKFSQEPWNSDNMNKTFSEFYHRMLQKPILCSGVMIGSLPRMKETLWTIYSLSRCVTGHDIVDQSALNILQLNHSFRVDTYITDTDESMIAHCAISGPTEFFVKWGFDKSYAHDLPVWDDVSSILRNAKGSPFSIVHQYNRIPKWKEAIDKIYKT